MTEQPIEQRTNPPTRFREASTALRSWGHAHRGLREALGDRSRSVEIVAAVQTRREMERALTSLGNWTETPAFSGPSSAANPAGADADPRVPIGHRGWVDTKSPFRWARPSHPLPVGRSRPAILPGRVVDR